MTERSWLPASDTAFIFRSISYSQENISLNVCWGKRYLCRTILSSVKGGFWWQRWSFIGCILQAVVESRNIFLVYSLFQYKSLYCWLTHKRSLCNNGIKRNNATTITITNTHTQIFKTKYYYLYQLLFSK